MYINSEDFNQSIVQDYETDIYYNNISDVLFWTILMYIL